MERVNVCILDSTNLVDANVKDISNLFIHARSLGKNSYYTNSQILLNECIVFVNVFLLILKRFY